MAEKQFTLESLTKSKKSYLLELAQSLLTKSQIIQSIINSVENATAYCDLELDQMLSPEESLNNDQNEVVVNTQQGQQIQVQAITDNEMKFQLELKRTKLEEKQCERQERDRERQLEEREFTDADETPHCPHLFIKMKYKTIRHILFVLIYLQFRISGDLQISVCKSPFPSAGTAVSLFRAKMVQQRPLLPREIETRWSDCGVTH